ncbi:class I SAM-dependent methyltransferase [Actinopolymorpha sp. B9G3]|uniref:class I SAM-dependent methyltransferase n=1 Tax=Actinopolymorpha sp. B9G3 TaxID=3158970 RepID=UPI0032D8E666
MTTSPWPTSRGPWEYEDVARRFLRPTDRVLDVGTGGGELFIELADAYAEGVGVDNNPDMVRTANRNRPGSLRDRISFDVMDGRALTFDADSFDVLLTRNTRFWPEQIVSVLRRGGYFVCQQVGEHMSQPILDAFGWGTSGAYWRRVFADQGDPLLSRDEISATFAALDCHIVATGHIDNRAWFCDLESLVFYMKAAPFPEAFDPAAHLEPFNRYLATAAGPRGYETTESWDLLVVQRR